MTMDTTRLQAALTAFPQAVPRAIVSALDACASAAIGPVREDFRRTFVTRGQWEVQSIRRTFADRRTLSLRIGSMHDYMAPHMEGGERAGGDSWVPMVGQGRPRTRKETRTTRSRWPSAMMARSRAFLIRTNDGSTRILERVGHGRASRLRTLYAHQKKVMIEARWELSEAVRRVFTREWPTAMKTALEAALARRR